MLFRTPKNLSVLIFAIAVPVLMAACSHADHVQAAAPSITDDHGLLHIPAGSPLRRRIKVQPVESGGLPRALSVPAVIEADPAHTLNVQAPVTGRVIELKVGLGDRVKRGQVLALIASGDYAQAQADRARAADALALTKSGLARAEGVQRAGGAAQKDLEAARSGYQQAQAEDIRAQARLASLGSPAPGSRGAGRMALLSPTDGSITSLSTAAGAFVNDPNAVLMTVTDIGHVWATANVAENESSLVAPGQLAEVTLPALPGRRFRGAVQSVSDVVDPDSRRVKARIALANPDGAMKANMFATAVLMVPQPGALLVPQSALLMNNDSVTVFVEVSPWTFARRTVELGPDEGGLARIAKGLRPGDRVVVAGGVLIND